MSVSSFPLAFPQAKFRRCVLHPHRLQAAGSDGGVRDFVVDRGQPRWQGEWSTNPLSALEMGQWRAWRDQLRGMDRFFLGWDPLREYPLAYMPAGWGSLVKWDGSAWAGTGALASVGQGIVARDLLGLADLPNGLVLNAGDYVEARWSDDRKVNADFTTGANSFTATNGTFPSGGGAYVLTPSGSNARLNSPSFSAGSGATYNRVYLDFESIGTVGSYSGTITLNGSITFAAAFRVPASGKRMRQVIDMSGNSTWTSTNITSIAFTPVSTNSGTYRFWAAKLESGVRSAQRHCLLRVQDLAPITADANGLLTAWVEPSLPAVVPVGALLNLYRAAGKFRKISESGLEASADGGQRPGDFTFGGLSTLV